MSSSVIKSLRPNPSLRSVVSQYYFVQDLAGEYKNKPVTSIPLPGAAISVSFGRPNAPVGGPAIPSACILGAQSVARSWISFGDTFFIMALLTPIGLARLFPGSGAATVDRITDLGAVLGDARVRALVDGVAVDLQPERMAAEFDRWFQARLERVTPPAELPRLSDAHTRLNAGQAVNEVAQAVEISRRQLVTWYDRHFGLSPKQLMQLERLEASVRAAQWGGRDPVEGFSDQAHQVRTWRARMGTTPGAYGRGGPSNMARLVRALDGPAFFL